MMTVIDREDEISLHGSQCAVAAFHKTESQANHDFGHPSGLHSIGAWAS